MPSLNFQDRFAPLIESGQKRQTIRLIRKKNPIKPGDKLYLFKGLRTKKCKRIYQTWLYPPLSFVKWEKYKNKKSPISAVPYVICKSVEPIKIGLRDIFINKKELMGCDKFSLALKDGFENYFDFYFFFKKQYGLPFEGVIIKW